MLHMCRRSVQIYIVCRNLTFHNTSIIQNMRTLTAEFLTCDPGNPLQCFLEVS